MTDSEDKKPSRVEALKYLIAGVAGIALGNNLPKREEKHAMPIFHDVDNSPYTAKIKFIAQVMNNYIDCVTKKQTIDKHDTAITFIGIALDEIISNRPTRQFMRENAVEMIAIKTPLFNAVDKGTAPIIIEIAKHYPLFLKKGKLYPDQSFDFNLTEYIDKNYPHNAAMPKEDLLKELEKLRVEYLTQSSSYKGRER